MIQDSRWNKKRVKRIRVHKRLGCAIDEAVWRIEEEIIGLNGGYTSWGMMREVDRARLRVKIRKIIREELLDKRFKEALGKSIVPQDGIPEFKDPFVKYILQEWYHGRVKMMLFDLGVAL